MEKRQSAFENYSQNIQHVENMAGLFVINAVAMASAAAIYEWGTSFPGLNTAYKIGAGAVTSFIGTVYELARKSYLENKVRNKIQDASEQFGIPVVGVREERQFFNSYTGK